MQHRYCGEPFLRVAAPMTSVQNVLIQGHATADPPRARRGGVAGGVDVTDATKVLRIRWELWSVLPRFKIVPSRRKSGAQFKI